ncbi:beta-amyrin 28-monooxygenase-like [Solanum stenotomum]|uniref:beta-amyrin 28-monooxygenase-like n=1 Tax=Solanum stenotomum TaxID=172797 RepID=UPI0020D1B3A5|nr:beta-amyrin 28-monooxygenase-like [Solanum stenotomum]
MDLFLLFIATLLAMIIISILFKYFFANPKDKNPLIPPGTFGLPIIGETIQFLVSLYYGLVHEFVQERTKKYNSNIFKTSILGQKVVVFSGPNANKFIFTRGNKLLIGWRPNSVQKLFPSTSFVPIEHDTKRAQNVMSYFLNSQNVETLISTMDYMSHTHLENHWKGNNEVIVYDLVKLFTFILSIRVFMGIENSDKILNLYEKFNIFSRGLLVLDINFPGTTFYKAMKVGKELRKEMKAIIEERRKELLENPNLSKVDVLTQVINEKDGNGKCMSEVEMIDKLFGFIIGSYHTTGTAITLIMKYLEEKHEFFNDIVQEQNEISRNMMPREVLCWNDIQKMKKTWNFVNEVLRDTPILQGTFREVIEDITYDGFLIPKGWKIYLSVGATQKNGEYFPNPTKFDPSRFEGNGLVPYTSIPFGGGQKMCPGKEFARIMILVFLHHVLKKFRWEAKVPSEKILCPFFLVPVPTNGYPVTLYNV